MPPSKGEKFTQQLEDREEANLARYALKSRERRESLGAGVFREGRDPVYLEYRTEYHRDRDRVVWSKSFKRLQHKTQIFPHYFEDHYRRRLTHSLEVAQIATTIARALGLNEPATEAMALGHDLGHTPFGHAGEEALNEILQEKCGERKIDPGSCSVPINGFDHCVHAIEVVSRIEQDYRSESDHGGLNLTFDVRDGILKHMFTRPVDPKRPLSTIAQATSIPGFAVYGSNNGSLEAQCVYFADKLAYLLGDMEDGIRSNILRCEKLEEDEFFKTLREKQELYRPGHTLPKLGGASDFPAFRSSVLSIFILECILAAEQRIQHYNFASIDDVLSCPDRIVQTSSEIQRSVRDFYNEWIRDILFLDKDVVACEFKAKEIVRGLFGAYLKNPYLINESYRKQCQEAYPDVYKHAPSSYELILVRNYIAGMTDFFAIQQHARLYMSSERITL